jgi:hypothetical protein
MMFDVEATIQSLRQACEDRRNELHRQVDAIASWFEPVADKPKPKQRQIKASRSCWCCPQLRRRKAGGQ